MQVSMKKIAEIVGCTPQAVSSVFKNNSTTRVSESLRRQVLHVAQELGYVPNQLSAALRRKRTGMIALILPWDIPEAMDIINLEAAKAGYRVLTLFTHAPDSSREIEALDAVLAWQVDGLIWLPYAEPDAYQKQIEHFRERSLPIVFLQRKLETVPGDFIGTDYRSGIECAVRHLQEQGYSEIYYLLLKSRFALRQERKQYFHEITGGKGTVIEVTTPADAAEFSSLLKRSCGVLCDDFPGVEFIHAALDAGVSIPEQIGVVMIGDHRLGASTCISCLMHPKMTSVRQEYHIQSRMAVECLIRRIKDKTIPYENILLPMKFTVRGSTVHKPTKKERYKK